MAKIDRREFLARSKRMGIGAAAGASMIAAPAIAKARAGANDRVRVALLGLGGRMHWHVRALAKMADEVEIVAVCDCDQNKLDSVAKAMPELEGKKLTPYTDMRKMFDDKSIDAVDISLGPRRMSPTSTAPGTPTARRGSGMSTRSCSVTSPWERSSWAAKAT